MCCALTCIYRKSDICLSRMHHTVKGHVAYILAWFCAMVAFSNQLQY
ncbi:unnamed protein product, partial [Vitis vinifera]